MRDALKIGYAREEITFGALRHFMPVVQRKAVLTLLDGEEGMHFAEVVIELVERIKNMPKTYDTEAQEDPVVYLHYFGGNYDAWITEKDKGDGNPIVRFPLQHQAFGWATFAGVGEAEAGYISIEELQFTAVELDLYWTPKPISEVLKEG